MRSLFGQRGVDSSESALARVISKFFFYATLILVIILAVELRQRLNFMLMEKIVTVFFLLNMASLVLLVKKKIYYLRTNWAYLIIIAVGASIFFHADFFHEFIKYLIPVLIVGLLLPWVDVCIDSLSHGQIGTMLVTALIILLLAGIFMSDIDPGVATIGDGLWWAFTSATTVGYGDIVPMTTAGKLLAVPVILVGLVLFSTITANIASFFVKRGSELRLKKEMRAGFSEEVESVQEEEQQLTVREDRILKQLELMHARLRAIENKMDKR